MDDVNAQYFNNNSSFTDYKLEQKHGELNLCWLLVYKGVKLSGTLSVSINEKKNFDFYKIAAVFLLLWPLFHHFT